MGKNVTLFSYMVMQHTAHLENLSSYTGPRGRVAEAEKGISLIRYCGSYGTPVLPGVLGMDSESPYVFPFAGDIFARVAYEHHFRALHAGRHEAEFISG